MQLWKVVKPEHNFLLYFNKFNRKQLIVTPKQNYQLKYTIENFPTLSACEGGLNLSISVPEKKYKYQLHQSKPKSYKQYVGN